MGDTMVSNVAERIGGVEKEYRSLVDELQRIRRILDDAERGLFWDTRAYRWLKELKDTANEMEDALDEWEKEKMEPESNDVNVVSPRPMRKVCPSFLSCCFTSKKLQVPHHLSSSKILYLKEKLDQLFKDNIRYNFDFDVWTRFLRVQRTASITKLFGRDEDRESLVGKLIGNGEEESGHRILTIKGMCGIGKTALAQIVYDDTKVEEFFELRIWILVSGEISEGIFKWVKEWCRPSSDELECLRDRVSGKKFLLVLDDVRTVLNYSRWGFVKSYCLDSGGAGSKILVTTKNECVADFMGSMDSEMHYLKQLSSNDCSRIIYVTARPEPIGLSDIAKKLGIVCNGLPLNAMFFGGLLTVWSYLGVPENVLENEIDKMFALHSAQELYHCLSLIYETMPPKVQDCFSYCTVFPKDHVIDVERLIECWAVRGYLGPDFQRVGRQYVEILATIFLFRDLEKSDDEDGQIKRFKMYDVVYEFAESIRLIGRVKARETRKTTCQVCWPLLVSIVEEYRSLFITPDIHEPPPSLCKDCCAILRILSLKGSTFPSRPQEIENLICLRWLDLSEIKLSQDDTKNVCKLYKLRFLRLSSCNLKEIPSEIENLSGLRKLDLSFNYFLKGLPENICCLVELETLNLDCCHSFSKLPQGIHKLTKLEHLHNKDAHFLFKFPLGLGSLTSLRTLTKFHGGSHLNKLKLLRNLNSLSGSLDLHIRLTDDLLEDAREAELKDKQSIQDLKITFYDYMDGKESSLRTEIIDALKPHQGLQKLRIRDSNGSTLPSWIISPHNQLRSIVLSCFNHLSLLPPLGILPHLEELCIDKMYGLKYVGRKFLGMTTETVSAGEESKVLSPTSSVSPDTYAPNMNGFPKLKKLIFTDCPNWEEWEDITTEEEKALYVQIMPCLIELSIKSCKGFRVLPLRLLHKASLLKVLDISGSIQLRYYDDKAWKSISQIPRLRIVP